MAHQPFDTTEYSDVLRREVAKIDFTCDDRIMRRLVARAPVYRAADESEVTELRRQLAHAANDVVHRAFSHEQFLVEGTWETLAAARARAGDDVADVVAALDATVDVVTKVVIDAATRIAAPGPIAVSVVLHLRDRLDDIRLEVHRRVHAAFGPVAKEERASARTDALVDLLLRHGDDPSRIVAKATSLGLDPDLPVLLVMAVPSPAATALDLGAGAPYLADALRDAVLGPAWEAPVPHTVAVAPYRGRVPLQNLDAAATTCGWVLAVAGPVGFDGLPALYERLASDLRLLPACTSMPGAVTEDVVRQHRLITRASVDEQRSFVHRVLGGVLSRHDWPDLSLSLHALFETPSGIGTAARRLNLHHNTVRKRVKLVEELTGLSTKVPIEAHRLYSAARLTLVVGPDGRVG